jgi:hypothetical protein
MDLINRTTQPHVLDEINARWMWFQLAIGGGR